MHDVLADLLIFYLFLSLLYSQHSSLNFLLERSYLDHFYMIYLFYIRINNNATKNPALSRKERSWAK